VPRSTFDAAYYRRFYSDRPVHDRRRIGHLASGIVGLCRWWGIPIRSVLDIGAGPGLWRDWFATTLPSVRYTSTDVSEHACARYGHRQRDITTWTPTRQYDLVICQGVLQYLDNAGATAAITNLAAASRSMLYIEVPTSADRVDVVDPDLTDLDIFWRTGMWYRKRLGEHFVEIGAGLHYARSAPVVFYELERALR